MQGLLYPAYQKFYSALSSLERFKKEANFFDNISCLDSFFAEYRNVTFAIQSHLKHTSFFEEYEKNRDIYLTDHWFVDKRNETTKKQPFRLQKNIKISVYTPSEVIMKMEKIFTVEDDIPLEALHNEIKQYFTSFLLEEIFFSTEYNFVEDGTETDLFGRVLSGISSMNNLLDVLYKVIDEQCPLCEKLRQKIDKMTFTSAPRDFLFIDDYVYYMDNNEFEKSSRYAVMFTLDGKKMINRRPIIEMTNDKFFNFDGTPFGRFSLMHAMLKYMQPSGDIMPAIMVIYGDETYDMDVFHADIKTTIYRKLNEVAKLIENEDVREVCFMTVYSVIFTGEDIPMHYKERQKYAVKDLLVVSSIDYKLNEKEYVFDGDLITNPKYVGYVMKNELKNKLEASKINMYPIWQAFNKKASK